MRRFPIAAILLLCTLLNALPAEKQIFVYQEKTENQITTHRFEIQAIGEGYQVKLSTNEKDATILQTFSLNAKLETLAWTYQETEKKTDISARKEGKFILLTGTHKGEPIEKRLKTKKLPWNQLFNKGLEPFVRSGRKKIKFRAIGTRGPGEMKITSFTVRRVKKPETIRINSQETAAIHIKISLSGLLSVFWTGHYWFRQQDGIFVRYRGKNGPGKPVSVMELTEERRESE